MSSSDEINAQLAEQMRNLADTMAASSTSTIMQTEILKKLAAAQGVDIKNIKGLDQDFSNLKGSINQQSAAYQANQKAAEEYAKAMGNFNAALTSSVSSLTSLGSSLLSTEKSFAKYNNALSSAGDAALSLGKNFGLVGMAIGGLVKVATMAAEQWNKQADSALKATDDLSKMGAAGSLTANEVLDMGHNAGLTSKNIEVLTKSAGRANTGLAILGSTVGDGTKAFGAMVAVTSEQRQAFQRLGVSQSELMDRQADYVKLQEMSGKSYSDSIADQKRLKRESLEYAEQLSRLSVLTGKSAEKLQEEQNAVQLEYEEVLFERQQKNKINKLRESGNTAEADALEKQEKARIDFNRVVTAEYGKTKGLEVARVGRTGQIDEKTSGLAQLGITVSQIQQGQKEGEKGGAKFSEDLKKAADKQIDRVGTAIGKSQDAEKLGKSLGLDAEFVARTGNKQNRNEEQALKDAQNKTGGAAEGKSTAGGAAATDPAQISRNKLTETEISAQVAVDKLVQATNPLLNGFNTTTIAATALAAAAGAAALALGVMAGSSLLKGGKGGLGKLLGGGGGAAGAAGAAEGAVAKEAGALGKMAGVLGKVGKMAGPLGAALSVGLAAKEGYDKVGDINKQREAGLISKNEATMQKSQAVGSAAGSAAGGAGGAWAGAAAGAAIGSVVPVVGTVIGGLLGAAVGGWLGSKGGEIIGEKAGKIAGDKLKDDSPGADRASAGLSEEDIKKQEEEAKKALQSEKQNTLSTDKETKGLTENTKALIDLTQALDDLSNIQTMSMQGGTEEEKQKRLESIYARIGAIGGRGGATGGGATGGGGGGTTPSGPISMSAGGAGTTPTDIAKALSAGGITDTKSQSNILAQVKGESGDFKAKSENLNYSPERLLQVFPNKVKSIEDAKRIVAGGPEAIGNLVYGGRMGNSADEGYKYRGRGLIGLTGKDNYAKFGKLTGVDLVKNPDLANDPEVAKKILVAYFKEAQKKGTNLADINSVGKAVGYATGPGETAKRSGFATQFASQLGGGGGGGGGVGPGPLVASATSTSTPGLPDAKKTLAKDTSSSGGSSILASTAPSTSGAPSATQTDPVLASINNLNATMSTKLDAMIDAIHRGNDTQSKILKTAKA